MWGTRSSVAGTGSRSFDLPTRNRESPAPNEQEIKPTESISIFSVHFTLNLPQASRLLLMNNLLRRYGNELEAEGSGVPLQAVLKAQGLFLFFVAEYALVISGSRGYQVVDDAGQFVGGGGDGLRGSQTRTHATIKGSQIGVASMQRLCPQTEGPVETAAGLARLGGQNLTPTLLTTRTQRQPTREGRRIFKTG